MDLIKTMQNAATTDKMFTTGQLFPDGTAIDLVHGSQLILLQGTTEKIAPTIDFGGTTYQPAPMHLSLQRALRLPATVAPHSTTESLIQALSRAAHDHIGTDDAASFLIAAFAVGTWVGDCLPGGGLVLNIWSPTACARGCLDFLESVVRRPLRVMEPSTHELLALPDRLAPTLVLDDPSLRALHRAIASSTSGGRMLNRGRVTTLQTCTAACTRKPVGGSVLNLSSPLGGDHRLSTCEVDDLAKEFQPRLLRYRLMRHTAVAGSRVAVPRFSSPVREIGQQLAAALEGCTVLQQQLARALEPLDENAKVERSVAPAAFLLEAVLVAIHESKNAIFVKELAELANSIAAGRHEHLTLTPKQAGAIVREELGLDSKRQAPGYEVRLDDAAAERIHEIGRQMGVLTMLLPHPGCRFCTSAK